jgi:hypothetical protein
MERYESLNSSARDGYKHTFMLLGAPILMSQPSQGIDKDRLASLTGHKNPDSALRVWYIAKKKLCEGDSAAESATSLEDVDTTTKGPKKTPTKVGTQTAKKRSRKQTEDEEAGEDDCDKVAPKRVKKASPTCKNGGVDSQDEL